MLQPPPAEEARISSSSSNNTRDEKPTSTPTPEPPPPSRLLRPPTAELTTGQILYIFGLHGLGAMIISGGINFGVAYAMYAAHLDPTTVINLWHFPHPLAGDAAVTIILQCFVTWFIQFAFVQADLRSGRIAPTTALAPSDDLSRWFVHLGGFFPGLEDRERATWGSVWGFVGKQFPRLAVVTVLSFCTIWGPGVGILAEAGEHVGGDFVYAHKWTPQVFKLLLGGVLGLLLGPFLAWFWMLRAGLECQRREEAHTPPP